VAVGISQLVLVDSPVAGEFNDGGVAFFPVADEGQGELAGRSVLTTQQFHAENVGLEGYQPVKVTGTGLEWERVDLDRQTAWLNQTKNGTPRGVTLSRDAVVVLEEQLGKKQQGLAGCTQESGHPGFSLSRSAAYLGLMASAGGDVLRRAERPGRLEIASDGGSIRKVCNRASGGCGQADRKL
jgi:hypothetical protein